MTEVSRTAAVVATNKQKLVQNVSSMQRMLVHVDNQGEGLRQQLRQLQHYTGQLAWDMATQLEHGHLSSRFQGGLMPPTPS